jgi:hypothetical protein
MHLIEVRAAGRAREYRLDPKHAARYRGKPSKPG